MAWNEPGGGNKDPWGGSGNNDGPPDLDEIARKMRERMSGFFGKKGSKGGKGGGSMPISFSLIGVLAVNSTALPHRDHTGTCAALTPSTR